MANFQESHQLLQEFKSLFEQPHPNLDKCKAIMDKLKVAAITYGFPSAQNISFEDQKKQLLLSRTILEYGAIMSILLKDIPAFERYIAQLKTHYNDYQKKFQLPPSSYLETILGLNLLRLISKNELDEFHTEIELLPPSLLDNVYIKFPVQLEQYMMEGSYNKIFKAQKAVPSPYYHFFMAGLTDTIRKQIANCITRSYSTLSISEAQRLLALSNVSQLQELSEELGWNVVNINGVEHFNFQKMEEIKTDIPAHRLMRQSLLYARELERIV